MFWNLKKMHLIKDDFANLVAKYIVPDSFVAIAAERNSVDTGWFITVVECTLQSNGGDTYDWGHEMVAEANFNKGHFLQPGSHYESWDL